MPNAATPSLSLDALVDTLEAAETALVGRIANRRRKLVAEAAATGHDLIEVLVELANQTDAIAKYIASHPARDPSKTSTPDSSEDWSRICDAKWALETKLLAIARLVRDEVLADAGPARIQPESRL